MTTAATASANNSGQGVVYSWGLNVGGSLGHPGGAKATQVGKRNSQGDVAVVAMLPTRIKKFS